MTLHTNRAAEITAKITCGVVAGKKKLTVEADEILRHELCIGRRKFRCAHLDLK